MIEVKLTTNSTDTELYTTIVSALDMVLEDARTGDPDIVIGYTTWYNPIGADAEEVVEAYIPADYVPIDYKAHTNSEKIVRGSELKEGDVILIADAVFRENPVRVDAHSNEYVRERLNTKSRWCRVTNLEGKTAYQQDLISYIGLYADGTMAAHTYNKSIYFIVKK